LGLRILLILLADPAAFLHTRGPAKIDRDEPALPLEPAGPEGDAIGPIAAGPPAPMLSLPAPVIEGEMVPEPSPAGNDAPEASDASETARQYFRNLGREAALRGEPKTHNPFRFGQPARKSWADGWKGGREAADQLAASDAAASATNGEAAAQ